MREIKFRAWDRKTRAMRQVMRMHIDIDGSLHVQLMGYTFFLEGSEIELMQYTGLKDKNGKEIYEGDIVAFGMGNKGKVEHSLVNSWCVEYNLIDNPNINRNYRWDDTNKVVQLWKLCQDNRAEVIGNIYENKELLNDG